MIYLNHESQKLTAAFVSMQPLQHDWQESALHGDPSGGHAFAKTAKLRNSERVERETNFIVLSGNSSDDWFCEL